MTSVIRWLGPALALISVAGSLGVYLLFTRGLVDRIPGGEHWEVHWTERNRVLAELRSATLLVGTTLALLVPLNIPTIVGRLSAIREVTLLLILAALHTTGIAGIGARTMRRLRTPELTVELTTRVRATAAAYWFVLIAVLIIVWTLGSSTAAPRLVGFAIGAALLLWSQWRGDVVLRRIGLLVPAPAPVRAQGALVGMEPSRVLELRATSPNALALPSGDVAVTTGLLSVLTPEQIRTVLRHERAHIAESRFSWVGRILPVALLIAFGPLVAMLFRNTRDIGALLVLLVVMCGVLVVLGRIQTRGRDLEAAADEHAAHEDPHVYAGSLETLYRVAGLPATHRQGTHPPLYDRLLAAGVQPDYARPDPPGRGSGLAGLGLALGITVAMLGTPAVLILATGDPLRTEIEVGVGYDGGTGPAGLAALAIVEGGTARADEILETATVAGYNRARLDIALVAELTSAGLCHEAQRRLDGIHFDGIEDHLEELAVATDDLYWYCT